MGSFEQLIQGLKFKHTLDIIFISVLIMFHVVNCEWVYAKEKITNKIEIIENQLFDVKREVKEGCFCSRGYFHIRRSEGLAPKFASEIVVGAPTCASKNIGDKYPKFCPLNFRFDPKIGISPNFCVL